MTACNSYVKEKKAALKKNAKRTQMFYLVWNFMNNLYHRRERPQMNEAER